MENFKKYSSPEPLECHTIFQEKMTRASGENSLTSLEPQFQANFHA